MHTSMFRDAEKVLGCMAVTAGAVVFLAGVVFGGVAVFFLF